MGVTAHLYEITPSELAACRADLGHAAAILANPRAGALPTRASCSLDKAAGGLHFLFTGAGFNIEAEVVAFDDAPRCGDREIVLIRALDVECLAENLAAENTAPALREHYAPRAMRGIYPDIWERDGEEGLRYLLGFLPALRAFFSDVSERGNAALAVQG
jgi:hypothetical protein